MIGGIYSLSSALDMSLFYPVGLVMDRWGRKWMSVPSMALFAFALLLFPLVTGFYTLLGIALLLGLANGLSAGLYVGTSSFALFKVGVDLTPLGDTEAGVAAVVGAGLVGQGAPVGEARGGAGALGGAGRRHDRASDPAH